MLKLVFAFDHVNYARYKSYQHVLLMEKKRMDTEAYRDLLIYGFGTSLTGSSFSGLHGDLLTELFNKETKGNAGPFRSGYSTKVKSVNTWVRTSHIHCEIRSELKEKLKLSTSTTHKEMSSSNMKRHNYPGC